ncbi:MAG TPA: amino acid permease [Spirochaetia bacterium]|nr:amino acid permease [Spirochaetia bacterium]
MAAENHGRQKANEPASLQQRGAQKVAGDKKNLTLLAFIMMGLGGAIGSGIFVVSGTPIRLAGPAILPVLLAGGIATAFITMMLAEMAVTQPVAGSWSVYADKYLGKGAGFLAGWMYWTSGVLTMATEVVAASVLVRWWLPGSPLWVFSLLFSFLVTGLNLLDVRAFAHIEAWLAFIKVAILIFFVIFGAVVLTGLIPAFPPPQGGLDTAFFAGGWRGTAAALILVMYAYAGVQIIGPSTGDLQNPQTNAPRALPFINGTLLFLYIASVAVLINLVKWSVVSVTGSPFVALFTNLNRPIISSVLNAIILSAVFSAINSNMYGIPRMLMSLARRKDAPRFLNRTDRRGVPVAAVLASAVCLLLVVVLSYFFPKNIFIYAASAGGVTSMFGWLIISITHLVFRQKEKGNLKLHYPGFPYTTLSAIIILLAALAGAFLTPQQAVGMYVSLFLLALYLGLYFSLHPGKQGTRIS